MSPRRFGRPAQRVVALGGGHGLAATLAALRNLSYEITAVVTVADDGGSSGRLRRELGVLPPGDLRMALAALCGDDQWGRLWADVLQHRFRSDGELHGHALGNLLIVALWELLDDHVDGLDLVGELLDARGRVLPMSSVPLDIEADVSHGGVRTVVRGQAAVATADGRVLGVRLDPHDPPACPDAVAAIDKADVIVIGPGSWYTSVIPNLLVPGIREALARSRGRIVVVLNLVDQPGETEGLSAAEHLDVLRAHADGVAVDLVVGDHSHDDAETAAAARRLGARAHFFDVASHSDAERHDPLLLAAAFRQLLMPV